MSAKPIPTHQGVNRLAYLMMITLFLCFPLLPINGFYQFLAQTFFYTAIAVTGLNILLGLSGQMSLGQAGFYALGAYGSALTSMHLGWNVGISILFGTCLAALIGCLVGVFALRTKGLYLAMTTLAVGYILNILAQRWVSLTGGTMGLSGVPALDFGQPKLASLYFFYAAGACLIFVQLAADFINQSRIGRNLRAIRESEVFAASVGIHVGYWKAAIFSFAAALAGLGGALFAHQSGFVGSDAFSVRLSVALLIAAVIGGLGTKTGPLLGTLILMGIVEIIAGVDKFGLIIYGTILLIVLLMFPKGAAGVFSDIKNVFTRQRTPTPQSSRESDQSKGTTLVEMSLQGKELAIHSISKSYRGIKAVDHVSIHVKPNSIHGLIGPNGAGKSTVINMIAGLYQADTGHLQLGTLDISNLSIVKRARLGLARTFQNLQLIEGVSVIDNVMLGIAHKHSYLTDLSDWLLHNRLEHSERKEAENILQFLGLHYAMDKLPSELPYGHRKLLELARAIAQKPSVLLLDEPIAGMNSQEAREIAQVILRLRSLGVTILLVEHNMEFVMSVCDEISVLNFGQLIATGLPHDIQKNEAVISAYLGTGAST